MTRRVPLHRSALSLAVVVTQSLTVTAAEAPPATPDEMAQLAVLSGAYGALTGYWTHQLTGQLTGAERHWSLGVLAATATTTGTLGSVVWLDAQDAWSLGQPQAIVTDTLIGSGIAGLWIWHNQARHPSGGSWSPALQTTLLWSGATVGAALGVLRYQLSPSPPGQAAWTGSVALWSGALSGLTAGSLTPQSDRRERNASLAAALGMEGGVILGSWLGRAFQPEGGWSLGWVRAVDAGALLGGAAAAGSYALVSGDPITSRTSLALAATGIVLGGVAGGWLAPRLGMPRDAGWTIAPELGGSSYGLRLIIHDPSSL